MCCFGREVLGVCSQWAGVDLVWSCGVRRCCMANVRCGLPWADVLWRNGYDMPDMNC